MFGRKFSDKKIIFDRLKLAGTVAPLHFTATTPVLVCHSSRIYKQKVIKQQNNYSLYFQHIIKTQISSHNFRKRRRFLVVNVQVQVRWLTSVYHLQ